MRRRISVVTGEILAAIDGIEAACSGKLIEDYQRDWLLRHGIQRGIEIISEAARHLPDAVLEGRPDIPWPQIKAMGNLLRHEYHRIADPIIWSVVTDDLPPLKAAVREIHDRAIHEGL
jgi:uncharacterized protein with HEPN domain